MNTYRNGQQTNNYHMIVVVVILAGFWAFATQWGAPSPIEVLGMVAGSIR